MAEDQGSKTAATTKKAAAPAPAKEAAAKAEAPQVEAPAATTKQLPPAPELPAAGKALVERALKAHDDKFPTKDYPAKSAFGHDYAKGTYTDHTIDWVQKLVWDLRQLSDRPTYRSIAEALGIQCSAITEAVTHGYSRKAKVTDDSWKVTTGGRVKFLQEREAAATKDKPAAAS